MEIYWGTIWKPLLNPFIANFTAEFLVIFHTIYVRLTRLPMCNMLKLFSWLAWKYLVVLLKFCAYADILVALLFSPAVHTIFIIQFKLPNLFYQCSVIKQFTNNEWFLSGTIERYYEKSTDFYIFRFYAELSAIHTLITTFWLEMS